MAPQGNNFDDFQFIGYRIRMDTHGYAWIRSYAALTFEKNRRPAWQRLIELARPPLVRMGVLFRGCRRALSSGWLAQLGFNCGLGAWP